MTFPICHKNYKVDDNMELTTTAGATKDKYLAVEYLKFLAIFSNKKLLTSSTVREMPNAVHFHFAKLPEVAQRQSKLSNHCGAGPVAK